LLTVRSQELLIKEWACPGLLQYAELRAEQKVSFQHRLLSFEWIHRLSPIIITSNVVFKQLSSIFGGQKGRIKSMGCDLSSMDTKVLEEIGLTNAEIKVYLALLELGTSNAGPILDRTGMQNSVVHLALNRLIEKGIVSYVKEGRRKQYQAANPKHLIEYMNEKKERLEGVLPQLLAIEATAKEKPEVIIFRGIRGIKELLYELLEAGGSEHHTFGSTKKSLMMGDAWWVAYHKKRAKKGIKAMLLFNESLAYWKAEVKYPKSEVRYTKEGFEPLTETIIRNDKIGLIIWSDKPIGMLIHQKEAAESYDKFFQMMWKSAK
jgi:sugar-specific transcriptional regulator TrmB